MYVHGTDLDKNRRDVLASSRDDELLYTPGDLDEAAAARHQKEKTDHMAVGRAGGLLNLLRSLLYL